MQRRVHITSFPRVLIFVSTLAVPLSCSNDLPAPSEVSDLRVLAIRADPPELLVDEAESLEVTFDALVVDPAGHPVTYRWQFCPVESEAACTDFDGLKAMAPTESQAVLDEERQIVLAGEALPKDDTVPMPVLGLPSFALTIADGVVAYHAQDSALGYGMGSWPSAVLTLRQGDVELTTQKRVVLNIGDLTTFVELAGDTLGVHLCTSHPDDPDCLDLRPRDANTNPEFSTVFAGHGERADTPLEPLTGPVEVALGQSLRIRPTFTAQSTQRYQRLVSGLLATDITVEDIEEVIGVSWFATEGSLQDAYTWPQNTRTLDTAYTAPDDMPATGRDTVWMVARDQRGGVAWRSVEITLTP